MTERSLLYRLMENGGSIHLHPFHMMVPLPLFGCILRDTSPIGCRPLPDLYGSTISVRLCRYSIIIIYIMIPYNTQRLHHIIKKDLVYRFPEQVLLIFVMFYLVTETRYSSCVLKYFISGSGSCSFHGFNTTP